MWTPRELPDATRDEAFGRNNFLPISGHQTLQLTGMTNRGSARTYVVTLPALLWCLEDRPDAERPCRRMGADYPLPHRGRDTKGGHLEALRPTGDTGETQQGRATQLGVGGSIVPATKTSLGVASYSFRKARLAGKGSMHLQNCSRFYKETRHNTSNTNSLVNRLTPSSTDWMHC